MISSPVESGSAAPTVPLTNPALDEHFTMHLREHVQQLQLIQPVISVAVMALHRQNAEADCDIALVLDHHAGAPLDFEIARLEAALASFEARRPQQVAA